MVNIHDNKKVTAINLIWEIISEETKIKDDAGCDWFTIGHKTYIGSKDWLISSNPKISNLVNSVNMLEGNLNLIN